MTWPFGGLPLGGVYLGQAPRPSWSIWLASAVRSSSLPVSGPAVSPSQHSAQSFWARRRHVGKTVHSIGVVIVATGVTALAVVGTVAPDGGAPIGTLRGVARPGGWAAGSEQAGGPTELPSSPPSWPRPSTWPPRIRLRVWCSGPRTSSRSTALWPGSPQATLLSRLAERLRATLLVGVTEPASATSFRNEVVAWGPSGHIVGVFEKVHRVPFGEYVQFRSLFSHFADLSGVPFDAIPGHGSGFMRTPAGTARALGVLRGLLRRTEPCSGCRPARELLAVPTNTSSYSTSQIQAQEMAAAIVQSVETGHNLVQAAPTGFDRGGDPTGRRRPAQHPGPAPGALRHGRVRRGFTPYDHWGDLPVLVLAALALLVGWGRQLRLS